MSPIDYPFMPRDSLEIINTKIDREEKKALDKAIDDKVNEAVKKYLETGQAGTWCVVS